MIAMCNNSPFGLASYFYSRDLGRVWRVAEALESGMVGVNTGLITTEVAPVRRRQGNGPRPRRLASRHGRICRDQIRDDGGGVSSSLPSSRTSEARSGTHNHGAVCAKLELQRSATSDPWLWVPALRRLRSTRGRRLATSQTLHELPQPRRPFIARRGRRRNGRSRCRAGNNRHRRRRPSAPAITPGASLGRKQFVGARQHVKHLRLDLAELAP